MAIRSVTTDVVEYILRDERDAPEKATIFGVKPQTVKGSWEQTALLQKATVERRGQTELNPNRLNQVSLELWTRAVAYVKNFIIDKNAVEGLYDKYRQRVDESALSPDGSFAINAETEEELRDVMKMLPPTYRSEVLDFAVEASTLRASEKN